MIATVAIAIAAGAASALMFASIISGALISLVLFYLAPLPLMVAAIGWGPLSAAIGGVAAAIGLGVLFGLPYCHRLCVTVGAAGLVARPSRPARPAGGRMPRLPATAPRRRARRGMVSGRPHAALDRRLCRCSPPWPPCSRSAPMPRPSRRR